MLNVWDHHPQQRFAMNVSLQIVFADKTHDWMCCSFLHKFKLVEAHERVCKAWTFINLKSSKILNELSLNMLVKPLLLMLRIIITPEGYFINAEHFITA